jgi:hypothetical protein
MPSELSFLTRSRNLACHIPTQPNGEPVSRLGMHYFSDSQHYREADLQIWLPELASLGVGWLILEAEIGRAIPEPFINSLVANQIQPVVRFLLPSDQLPPLGDLQTLLEVYSRWGVRYVSFYDRPNDRSTWPAASWGQQDLVERFLDRFIPSAEMAYQSGLTPIFPPLEPGGSYWDTAFLRSSLQSLIRRKQERLARSMALSAYAWTFNKPLNWGSGGPENWPRTRPYLTPADSQDQRGFRIFDWYAAIAKTVLDEPLPIFLFQAGLPGPDQLPQQADPSSPNLTELNITRLLQNEKVPVGDDRQASLEPIPSDVICSAFWLLSANSGSPDESHAWYAPDGKAHPRAETIRAYKARAKIAKLGANRVRHYLLLPAYEWGIDEFHLEAIRPFLRKYRPAVGFSIDEAVLADMVTVIGDETIFPEDALNRLRQAGCRVERISGDGTTIASLLAER